MLAGARPAPADPNVHAHNGFVSLVAFYGAALAEANARWELAGREIARLTECAVLAEQEVVRLAVVVCEQQAHAEKRDPKCTCAEIQAGDGTRHFRECPLCAVYPEREGVIFKQDTTSPMVAQGPDPGPGFRKR